MKEIVILGAGYAGLRALHVLQKQKEVHITLVDRHDYHYEATDLHEVAAGTQTVEKITYQITDIIDTIKTTFICDEVVKIDVDKEIVHLKENAALTYDYLIVALGFESETFGIAGAAKNALPMVDIPSAQAVHDHIMAQMQAYQTTPKAELLKIVVCGAGFTGIELVGALAEERPAYAKVAGVSADKIEIYCIEAMDNILPMFNEDLKEYCKKELEKRDIHMLLSSPIKAIEENQVVYGENQNLPAATIIWTTGVSGSHVIADSGFQARRGRVMVKPDLTAPDHANVYIVGDVAAVMDDDSKRPYPTTAQISLKMGEQAAKNILRQIQNQATEAFHFKSLGSVASLGNTDALGVVGSLSVKGYPASFMKKMIMNKSLLETGGTKEVLSKGRFDLYH